MLRPGEKAATVLGGAEVQGWPPGCGGACEPLPSCELLRRGGAGPPESARARAELPAPAAALLARRDVAPVSPA